MQNFAYIRATSIDEAVRCLSGEVRPVQLLSGGTDLLVQLREGRKQAGLVVDIKEIPELATLRFSPEEGLRIGAAVACRDIAKDPVIAAIYPGLVEAVELIGGTQIQSRASVGGNLCNASPAGDSIPALIVHYARCVVAGPRGMRDLAVEHFCTGPGKNALAADEMLVTILVPAARPGFGAAYLRFIPRNEMDIAVVGAGASVQFDEQRKRILAARVAVGAVAPTPLLVEEAGAFLVGREGSEEDLREAANIAQSAARPIGDMRGTQAQRKHLAFVLVRRALARAVGRARSIRVDSDHGHASTRGE